MSHYHIAVLVPPGANNLAERVAGLMAPHSEELDPDTGHWDWWRIGGRWCGKITGTPCNGDGFNFDAKHERLEPNMKPVSELDEGFTCWGIVTPDGEWREEGYPSLEEWASRDLPDEEQKAIDTQIIEERETRWYAQMRSLLAAHNDCTAVSVDIHR